MGHNGIIAAASKLADTEAPTAPGKPTKGAVCQTTLTLSWTASTDNVAVTGYNIYDDGVLEVDAGDVLTYNLTGLSQGSSSGWTIKAYDAASNLSAASSTTNITQGVTVNSVTMNLTGQTSGNNACGEVIATGRYLTGPNSTFTNGDIVYTDSCGITKFNGGGDYYADNADFFFQISSAGAVSLLDTCTI